MHSFTFFAALLALGTSNASPVAKAVTVSTSTSAKASLTTSCSYTTPSVEPSNTVCGSYGTLNTLLINQLSAPIVSNLASCVNACEAASGCVSFGYAALTGICSLYGTTLSGMGIITAVTGTQIFYKKSCFVQTCSTFTAGASTLGAPVSSSVATAVAVSSTLTSSSSSASSSSTSSTSSSVPVSTTSISSSTSLLTSSSSSSTATAITYVTSSTLLTPSTPISSSASTTSSASMNSTASITSSATLTTTTSTASNTTSSAVATSTANSTTSSNSTLPCGTIPANFLIALYNTSTFLTPSSSISTTQALTVTQSPTTASLFSLNSTSSQLTFNMSDGTNRQLYSEQDSYYAGNEDVYFAQGYEEELYGLLPVVWSVDPTDCTFTAGVQGTTGDVVQVCTDTYGKTVVALRTAANAANMGSACQTVTLELVEADY